MNAPDKATAPTFPFHHGRLALSFAGTLGDRGSTMTERVKTAQALHQWLQDARLTPETAPLATAPLYRHALRLREAIARCALVLIEGGWPAPADIKLINDAARQWAPRPSLDAQTLALTSGTRDAVEAALGRIAVDAIELFADPEERTRLRTCALDSCGAIFLTPLGRRERRWCSMARCGNRAKVSAFRNRASK